MNRTFYLSSNGENNICFYEYGCAAPRAVLYFSHGMGEHMGRFEDFAVYLNGAGIAVCGEDHLGHGLSAKDGDDLGYISRSSGWECLVRDSAAAIERTKLLYPRVKCFALGFSLGSYILRCVMGLMPPEIDGFMLAGAGAPNDIEGKMVKVLEAAIREKGARTRDADLREFTKRFISDGATGEAQPRQERPKRRKPLLGDADYDPLYGFHMTLAGTLAITELTVRAGEADVFAGTPKELPLAFFSGGSDPVGAAGGGVEYLAGRYRREGLTDVEVHRYPGQYHEIIKPKNRDTVYRDILSWLDRHI